MPSSSRQRSASFKKTTAVFNCDLSKTLSSEFSLSEKSPWGLSGSQMRLSSRSQTDHSAQKTLSFRDVSGSSDVQLCSKQRLSDRPWTASATNTSARSLQSQRLPAKGKSIQRCSASASSLKQQRQLNWSSRASSSQSLAWCSSVDSELATVGSDVFDSDTSGDRHSFAIFTTSVEESEPDKTVISEELPTKMSAEQKSQPTVHFELPFHEDASENADQETARSVEKLDEDSLAKATGSRDETNEERAESSARSSVSVERPPREDPVKMPVDSEDPARSGSVLSRIKLQSNKLREIIRFLDDADCNSRQNTGRSSSQMEPGHFDDDRETTSQEPAGREIDALHGMSNKELVEEILALKVLLDDKEVKLATVERALHHQRELLSRNAKSAQRELNMRLKAQKDDYEATLERHVGFIQQLVDEKKKLAEKCQNLASELRQLVARHEDERRVTEERHTAEIRRLKQSLASSNRQKQDKWVVEKTERIREMTARGLEPELRRLMGQHQQELQGLRTLHQGELLRAEQNLMQKNAQQLTALREQLDVERETACAREREAARAKFEKQLEDTETMYADKYRRLQADLESEKQHIIEEGERLRRQQEEASRKTEETFRREKNATMQILQAELEALKEKHQDHICNLRRQWEAEKADEIANVRHVLELKLSERERVWAESRAKEREDEVQKFTKHMAEELNKHQEEWEAITESRIARMREKHSAEVSDLERSESDLREKCSEMRRTLSAREEELASLRVSLVQRIKELEEANKTLEQFTSERGKLRDVLQKEVSVELERLDGERRQLRSELSRFRTEYTIEMTKKDAEVQQLIVAHEKSLADIHEKVKQTVTKKDETQQQTQQKLHAALLKCQHLEELLDRQQREFTFKKK